MEIELTKTDIYKQTKKKAAASYLQVHEK